MPKVNSETKHTRYERFIDFLMESPSRNAAIQKAGISSSTADRWLRDPSFVELLSARRHQLSQHLCDRTSVLLQEAMETLRRNMSSGVPSVEVRAATALAEISINYLEKQDLSRRIAVLEGAWEAA